MWTVVALTTVMTLAPAQGLELKNVRSTHGIMGETRKDDKLLAGDVLVVTFDIEGLKVKDNGLVQYAIGTKLTKKGKEKPEFVRDPQDFDAENSLGGSVLPAFALQGINQDYAPGEYTFSITVKDRLAKTEKVLDKTFEVVPKKLGFVQVRMTTSDGPAPPIAAAGQRIYFHCALVGFEVKEKKPNVTFEMVILDDAGKPTVAKSFKGDITTEQKGSIMFFVARQLDLNKPGKYKIQIKAKCNNSMKETEQTMSLNVLSSAG